jgi:GNAT superfamily N-acetyltransferase
VSAEPTEIMAPMTNLVPLDPLDPRDEARFTSFVDTFAAAEEAVWGGQGSAWTLEEIREMHRSPDSRRTALTALEGDAVFGAAMLIEPLRENTDTAGIWLAVHPDHWRRGIGSLLLQRVEALALEHGRGRIVDHTSSPHESGDPAASFARAHGYASTQEGLRSDLALPLRPEVAHRVGTLASDPAYQIETGWDDDLPREWLEDRAVLARRMSTDAPAGTLELDEEEWDAARVQRTWDRARAMGRHQGEAVARHLATGRLVGFTGLAVSRSAPELAYQQDTLVLREHRGHGLGLALKLANLARLRAALPGVSSVRTWNARSNEPMLRVNRALGFVVTGYFTEWEKVLAAGAARPVA